MQVFYETELSYTVFLLISLKVYLYLFSHSSILMYLCPPKGIRLASRAVFLSFKIMLKIE